MVFAECTQDVADAVQLCAQYKVPVIPFGVGSSLEGHLLAVQGGISIDLMRMSLRVTPGCTVTVRSSALMDSTLFMRVRSMLMPPCTASKWPSSEEPTPTRTWPTR